MPPVHRCSRMSSRIAFLKYFATSVANGFGGSWP